MTTVVEERAAATVEAQVDLPPPLLHTFPGFERADDGPVPVGAVARCGYRCQGISQHVGAAPLRDCCVVCESL